MSYDERSYYAGQQEGRRESEAKIRDLQAALKTTECYETKFRREIKQLHAEIEAMRAQGALMVHALDRAVVLNEALFSFWPPDVPMNPNVSACKQQYNEAMDKVFQRRVGTDHD
jgi:septal ring factor EnvC (AmiA/AmiB activator)